MSKLEHNLCLDRYADLLVRHGLNVQPGQDVYLQGEIIHRDLLFRLAEASWRYGARYVGVEFSDPYLTRLRILKNQCREELLFVPGHIATKFDELVDGHAAFLRIVGSEAPDLLSDLDVNAVHEMQMAYRRSISRFYTEGINRSQVHWCLAAAATPLWAKKVFPELEESEALPSLWQQIFTICRVDTEDYLRRWEEHDRQIKKRAEALTKLKLRTLHFKGPGTDLRVGLSEQARFTGGGEVGARAAPYAPNIPSEECYTTPDCRLTEGYVAITRPFMLSGTLVEGLKLVFEEGRIVELHAESGEAAFTRYIEADEGAKLLGEVALVGIDSPIYQSGLLFQETLYDENAACHIAVGFAYRSCLEGGLYLDDQEARALGCNSSSVHADMMISSEEVDVTGITYGGEEVALLLQGSWVE